MPEPAENPTLSIVMPVFNASRYIAEAIESLIRQTYTDFELLVIDDGSTDNSMEIVAAYSDSRIRVLRNDGNKGIVYTRNRGLREMRGRYYAPFDADDIAMPRKFEKQLAFMEQNTDYGLTGTWARHIDPEGRILKTKWKLNAKQRCIPAIQLFRAYFIQSSVVFRKEAIARFGYTDGFEIGEDYLLYHQISLAYKCANLPEYLIHYRIHPKSITQSQPALLEACEQKLYQVLYSPLKIEISPERFSCLLHLKNAEPIKEAGMVNAIAGFLLLVLKQNKTYRMFSQKVLAMVVLERWMKVCYKTRRNPESFLLAVLRIFAFLQRAL